MFPSLCKTVSEYSYFIEEKKVFIEGVQYDLNLLNNVPLPLV